MSENLDLEGWRHLRDSINRAKPGMRSHTVTLSVDDFLAKLAALEQAAKDREYLREKNDIIRAYAGPAGMTPEDVAAALGRIPELERELENERAHCDLFAARIERVEALAREHIAAIQRVTRPSEHLSSSAEALRAALATAPVTRAHAPTCAWLACIQAATAGGTKAMARMVRDGCPPCDCGFEAGPGSFDPVQMADDFVVAESNRDLADVPAERTACARCGNDPAEGHASIGDRRYCHGEESPSCYMRTQWERAATPAEEWSDG